MDDGPNPYSPPNEASVEPPRKVVRLDDAGNPRIPGPVLVAGVIALAILYTLFSWLRY